MIQVFANFTRSAQHADTSGWDEILLSLLLTTVFLFLLPSFLVGGLAILGLWRIWMRGVKTYSMEALDLATVVWARRLSWSNADPYLWKKRGARGYWLFFWPMCPNCLALSCIIPFNPGLESFLKKSKEVGLFWSPISIKHDKDGLKRRWDALSWISSHWYWESYLMQLQVVYMEALELPRLF